MSLVIVIADLEFKLSFERRIQSFIESSCLLISILEVGRPVVRQEVDQSVGVLAPSTMQTGLTQVYSETACSVVDLGGANYMPSSQS